MKVAQEFAPLAGALLLAFVLGACGGKTSDSNPAQGSVLVHNNQGGMTELLGATWTNNCQLDTGGNHNFRESLQILSTGTIDTWASYASIDTTCMGATDSNSKLDDIVISTAGDEPNAKDSTNVSVPATRLNITGSFQGLHKSIAYVVTGSPDQLYIGDEASLDGDGYPYILQNFGRLRQ